MSTANTGGTNMSRAGIVEPDIVEPDLPPDIKGWNWGAFLLSWIWGIGNNTFIALLALIPLVGLIMHFVLGAKGNAWAWRNGRWDSVAHFKQVQRRWAIAGLAIWLGGALLFGGIFGGVFTLLKHSEAYTLAVAKVQASPVAANVLGAPIAAGTPSGSIKISGESGTAVLNFSVTGAKAKGTVFVDAIKEGTWTIRRLTLKVDGSDRAIDLLTGVHAM